MKQIAVGQHVIGEGAPCFIIAEAGVNHDGDLAKAYQLVDVALASGADAVTFQTFRPELLAPPQRRKGCLPERDDRRR